MLRNVLAAMNQSELQAVDVYARRIIELTSEIEALRSRLSAVLKFVAMLGALFCYLAYLGFVSRRIPAWPAIAILPVPIALAVHAKQLQRQRIYLLDVRESYETGIARLRHDWDKLDEGAEFADPTHDYASDLDLFGRGSMFQLLCSARTRLGRETLAQWLKNPADVKEVRARHEAILELRGRGDLREAIAGIRTRVPTDVRRSTFKEWTEAPAKPFRIWSRAAGALLAIALVVLLFAYGFSWMPRDRVYNALAIVVALELIYAGVYRADVTSAENDLAAPRTELPLVLELIDICARENFSSAKLIALKRKFHGGPGSAGRRLRRLRLLTQLLKLRDDPWLTILCYALVWGTQFTMAIEGWRLKFGSDMLDWLSAAGEFEALLSLSCYAFEHPADAFPELVDAGPQLSGKSIGHPLLDEDLCVSNDVDLNGDPEFLIVSGSNMSGKSTYLRAIGLNAVLAWMGAPVRCASLLISPLKIICAIRIQDSITQGESGFYAAMLKLRRMIEAASKQPTLFLADEIMSGTNSHDRRIAAEWVIRALISHHAIGAISTHDLALAEIASNGLPGRNVCFEDSGESGELHFDYKPRPGLPTRSNALNIARMLGIPTE